MTRTNSSGSGSSHGSSNSSPARHSTKHMSFPHPDESAERQRGNSFPASLEQSHSDHWNQRHKNAHSECGRHGNDWLLRGFSVTETFRRVFGRAQN